MRKTVALLLALFFLAASCMIVAKPALSSADVAENSWASKAPMHHARSSLGAAAVNGKIYAIGGSTRSGARAAFTGGVVGTNEEYDPATDAWRGKVPMPTPRESFAIASYEGKIYCIGGYTANGSITGVNEVYDPATNKWQTKTPMPTPRANLQANVVNGTMYLIGGFIAADNSSGYDVSTAVEVYDPATDMWTQKAPSPYCSAGYATAALDGKIYILAGSRDNLLTTRNIIYDIQSDTWTLGSSAPSYFMSGAAVATTGVMAPKRVHVFDAPCPDRASHPDVPLYSTQVYDPEMDSWMAGADLPTGQIDAAVAVVDDMIYVIGGYRATYRDINDWVYGPQITEYATNDQYTPFGYGTVPPVVQVVSPVSQTYNESSVSLVFTVNKQVNWMGYSLDGQDNVAVTGNATLSGLANGLHNVAVYAKDEFGNEGASETISFTVEAPFPTTLVAAPVASVAVVGAVLAIYFKKRKRQAENHSVKKS
jgi:N-acetylneuraminic acid mutarotase